MLHTGGRSLLRLVSWNVKGLGNPVKRAKVLANLKHLQPNKIFFKKTKATGVAILSKKIFLFVKVQLFGPRGTLFDFFQVF